MVVRTSNIIWLNRSFLKRIFSVSSSLLYFDFFWFFLLLLHLLSFILEQDYKSSRELFTVDDAKIDGTHNTLFDIDPIKRETNKIIALVVIDWLNPIGCKILIWILVKPLPKGFAISSVFLESRWTWGNHKRIS